MDCLGTELAWPPTGDFLFLLSVRWSSTFHSLPLPQSGPAIPQFSAVSGIDSPGTWGLGEVSQRVPPGTVGLLFEPGDSLWIPVTDAAGGQLRGLQPRFRAGSSLLWPPPALALSNFSPMLLLRSCVSPAYSVWTAADCILLVTRSRCPPAGAHPCLPAHSFSAFLLSSTD